MLTLLEIQCRQTEGGDADERSMEMGQPEKSPNIHSPNDGCL